MKKYIFTENKNLFTKVLAGVLAFIALIFLVAMCFMVDGFSKANPKCYHKFILSTFHGSYDAKDMPSTYWQVKSYESEDTGEKATVRADVKLHIHDYAETKVDEIWINISDLASNEIHIGTYTFNDTGKREYLSKNANKTPFVITREQVKASKDGWFKIYDAKDTKHFIASSLFNKNYSISFSTEIRIREMVFIGYDTKDVKEKYRILDEYDSIDEYINIYQNNDANNPIKNIFDETSLFPKSKMPK